MPAKKSRRTGSIGNSAKKEKRAPKGPPPPPPNSIRRTKSQSTTIVPAKKRRVQREPTTWIRSLVQRKIERRIGSRERRKASGFSILGMLDGSTLTWISPSLRYATLIKFGPKRSSPSQRAIPPNCRRSSLTATPATRLLLTRAKLEAQRLTREGTSLTPPGGRVARAPPRSSAPGPRESGCSRRRVGTPRPPGWRGGGVSSSPAPIPRTRRGRAGRGGRRRRGRGRGL